MPNKLFDSIRARVRNVSRPSPDIVKLCRQTYVGVWTEDVSVLSLRKLLTQLMPEEVSKLRRTSDVAARRYGERSETGKLNCNMQVIIASAHSSNPNTRVAG